MRRKIFNLFSFFVGYVLNLLHFKSNLNDIFQFYQQDVLGELSNGIFKMYVLGKLWNFKGTFMLTNKHAQKSIQIYNKRKILVLIKVLKCV